MPLKENDYSLATEAFRTGIPPNDTLPLSLIQLFLTTVNGKMTKKSRAKVF